MAPKTPSKSHTNEKLVSEFPSGTVGPIKGMPTDYTSHGVTNNDIFLLPSSDFQLLGLLTIVASVVRLFRIYQPSSVVFDEVQ